MQVDGGMMPESENELISAEDRDTLREAARLLENPGFFIRIVNFVGAPVNLALRTLPSGAETIIRNVVSAALERALDIALYRLERSWGLFQNETIMKGL